MQCIYNQEDDGWIKKEDIEWCEKCKKCQDKKPAKSDNKKFKCGNYEGHDPKGGKYCHKDGDYYNIEQCEPEELYNGVCPGLPELEDCTAHDPEGGKFCTIDKTYEDIKFCDPTYSIDKKCPGWTAPDDQFDLNNTP